MSLLFDQQQNDAVDSNGAENITDAAPGWFQNTGSELARGGKNIGVQAERVFGQMDSTAADALGVNRYITRQGKVEQIHDIEPTPTEELPKFEKPDVHNSGAAAIVLGDMFQQLPTLVGAFINPAVGFAAGVSSGAEQGKVKAQEMGVKGPAYTGFVALSALEEGIGGALPGVGGIGENALLKYGSRFVVGGSVNVAQSEAFKWGRAELLDHFGFHQQAQQERQFDMQQAAATFIMGGFFNLAGGHAREKDVPQNPDRNVLSSDNTTGLPPELEQPTIIQDATPTPDAPETPRINTGTRMSREEVKQAKSDIVNSQRHLDRLDAERANLLAQAPKGSGKVLAAARADQQQKLQAIEAQRQYSLEINNSARDRMAGHEDYNRQRIDILQADAATHTLLHDNYVTESAPGMPADIGASSAHAKAMDSTMAAIHEGRAVDVSEHFQGDHTFIARNDLDLGHADRAELSGNTSARMDAVQRAAAEQALPEKVTQQPQPGTISDVIAEPFNVLRAQVSALQETHPELAAAMAPHIDAIEAEHFTAQQEAGIYDIAAACAISYGS